MTHAEDYISARTRSYSEDELNRIKNQLEQLIDSKEAKSEFVDFGKISTSTNNISSGIENLKAANESLFRTLTHWLKGFGWSLVFEQNDNSSLSKSGKNPHFPKIGTYYLVPTKYIHYSTHD